MATLEQLETAFHSMHRWIVQGNNKRAFNQRWGRELWIADISNEGDGVETRVIYGPDAFMVYWRSNAPPVVGFMGRIDLRNGTTEKHLTDAAELHVPMPEFEPDPHPTYIPSGGLHLQRTEEPKWRVQGGTASPSPTESVLPWQHPNLKDWRIVNVHHYIDENGEQKLSVTMMRANIAIQIEGRDEPDLWNELREKANEIRPNRA